MFIIIIFGLGFVLGSGILFFFPAVLLSIRTAHSYPLFLFHCLISFLLFRCPSVWENTRSCMTSTFPIESYKMVRFFFQTVKKGKAIVFYGQEPPSGESTTTECGVNYQLLAVIYWSSPFGNSLLQLTTTSYGQWRQRRLIQFTSRTPHPYG